VIRRENLQNAIFFLFSSCSFFFYSFLSVKGVGKPGQRCARRKNQVYYVGGKQEDEWIDLNSGRLRLPKSTATGDFSRINPRTRPANMKRHTADCAAVNGDPRGGVPEGEAVKGIGAGGVAGGRPPVLGEGAVDVVGDKAKQNKGKSRLENSELENSELFFAFFSFSDVFRDAEVIKKLCIDVCFTRIAMHTTVREELVEAADLVLKKREKIGKKYCGRNGSPRRTYVIALYDHEKQWFVGEGVCFSL
jgi:hypothetical protein